MGGYGNPRRHGQSPPALRRAVARAPALAAGGARADRRRADGDHRAGAVARLDPPRQAARGRHAARPPRGRVDVLRFNNGEMPAGARRSGSSSPRALDDEHPRPRPRALRGAAARAARDRALARRVAGEMERHYSPGRTWEALGRGLIGLLRLGDVLDAGRRRRRHGAAPRRRARAAITCVDQSETLIEAARVRLGALGNARCQVADLQRPALRRRQLRPGAAVQRAHLPQAPARALAEAARVLRPGGSWRS